jgi:hypothetical protein
VIALCVGLAGCSPGAGMPVPEPSGTTSEAAPESLNAPVVRVPTPCSELGSASVLGEWFEIVAFDESKPVDSLDDAATWTAGALRCRWTGPISETGYSQSHLDLLVRPQATGYEVRAGEYIDDQYTDFDTAGDDSVLWCSTWEQMWSCGGEMRVGEYWVSAGLQAETSTALAEAVAKQRMQNTLQRVSAALRSSPPTGAAWARPADAFDGASVCAEDRSATIAVLEDAWGLTGMQSGGGDVAYTDWTIFDATDSVECAFWAEPNFIRISVLPGAAWWGETWDEVQLDHWTGDATFEALDIEGADRVMVTCESPYCIAYVIAAGSAFEVTTEDMSREDFVSGLVAIPQLAGV